ncbi:MULTISPECIES: fructose-6-phosphate aldolase [unclassified Hydrogenobaculum]|uniref:fructose-6-phosphate aldolase n=1 Tax=unclassified Hydrogenobaculum TaxID=2622382 RepID=UPI0001C50721|nr:MULTISPECIES: fructose-6-phosphate aldolase [unclassified Hydrogenobaculum]AEF19197.1 transaldolase [Hydrogenobaculum sp. 3684]AEG46486.1 transaldolase [Hydrogenobaculum sp. SHO]AGG15130.1 transaldolase [Hydrogenobaculum sp. HO]AGH93428.1 fructose-6-phosphate aldolase, TalC/MipB family [Hydrogenobaculum sp. SN]
MQFFIDTANIDEIKQAIDWGILDGVTTNPTLAAKTGRPFMDVVKDILSIVDGPVSLETVSLDTEGMVKEGRFLAELGDNVVVKIPMTKEGMKAVNILEEEGIPTNVTLIFSPMQALIAAKAGASYVSPFIGRLDDISTDGLNIVRDIRIIFDNYGYETEIIAASIRHPIHVLEAAKAGADIATIPFNVLEALFKHPLTDIGIEKFLKDWEKVPNKPF